LIVHTVPSELVHVPASAAGPEVGAVAQAVNRAIETAVKMIRTEGCNFMGVHPASERLKVKLTFISNPLRVLLR
jgi:hypothetical protein